MTSTVLEREAVIPARVRWDPRRSLRQLALAGVPLVALTAAWYGYHWWSVRRFIESTDDAYVGGDITVIAPKVAGFITEVAVPTTRPCTRATCWSSSTIATIARRWTRPRPRSPRSRRRSPTSTPPATCRRRW